MPSIQKCFCGQTADKMCSSCREVFYCSPEHQKQDWKSHKPNCKIYLVEKNEKYGRYVVAARDILPGEIIMSEYPLVYGPKQETRPICLGCHNKNNIPEFFCTSCGYPMCSKECEMIPIHADNECKVFSPLHKGEKIKIKNYDNTHPAYECILAIRSLLSQENNPKIWKKLTMMESHNESRKKMTNLWLRNQNNVVKLLREKYKLTQFSEETIHTVIGYADVNSFEILTRKVELCGLYHNFYLLAHHCLSNTINSITDDFKMKLRAVIPIKKGELITTAYIHTDTGTLERRQNLFDYKFFYCDCRRCSDSTELNTNFSSVKCEKCEKGYLLPKDSLDKSSKWGCSICSNLVKVEEIIRITDEIKNEIEKVKRGRFKNPGMEFIEELENILVKYSGKTLHENHYLMVSVEHNLSELYGRLKGATLQELNLGKLERKQELCEKLLRIYDILEPGWTRLRGLTLYELHASIYFKSLIEFKRGMISKDKMANNLHFVLKVLKESKQILDSESPTTNEWKIAKSIPESIQTIESHFKQFKL